VLLSQITWTYRHNIPWTKCVPQIIPAKRRLLEFVKELCSTQELSNKRYEDKVTSVRSTEKRRLHGTGKEKETLEFGRTSQKRLSSGSNSPQARRRQFSRKLLEDRKIRRRRGIVYTGIGEHFHDIFQSIYSLRLLGIKLPVEIWVNEKDHNLCSRVFGKVSYPATNSRHLDASTGSSGEDMSSDGADGGSENRGVKCMKLPNFVRGFTSKFYTLLYTSFTDVLFIDADNVVVGDVNSIFDSQEYIDTGSVLWADLWGNKCQMENKAYPGESSYENHVLFVARFGGLKWENKREYAQEAETGQMAFDLVRHKGLLDFGRRFIEDQSFFKKIINGDKDIFRFAHLITGQPFYFVPHFPGYSFSRHERDCLVHFYTPSSSSSSTTAGSVAQNSTLTATSIAANKEIPMFFHQLKTRNPESFSQILRIPLKYRNDPSACIILGQIPDESAFTMTENGIEDRATVASKEPIDSNRQVKGAVERKGARERGLSSSSEVIPVPVPVPVDLSGISSLDATQRRSADPVRALLTLELDSATSESSARKRFAMKLFNEVDSVWKRENLDRMIYLEGATVMNYCNTILSTLNKRRNEFFGE
jgi:Mannosyltransferase putative